MEMRAAIDTSVVGCLYVVIAAVWEGANAHRAFILRPGQT